MISQGALATPPPPPVRHIEVQEPPRTQGDDKDDSYTEQPFLVLRVFPVMLYNGVGQIGAEIRILEKLTVLPQFSYGRVKVMHPLHLKSQRQSYLGLDLYGRYYAIGSIKGGIYANGGLSYVSLDSDQLIPNPLMNLASGAHFVFGLGGNYTFPYNLSLDIQFLLADRFYQPKPSIPSPPDLDRAVALRFGATLAVGYLF